jgi:hypothetical protein
LQRRRVDETYQEFMSLGQPELRSPPPETLAEYLRQVDGLWRLLMVAEDFTHAVHVVC